MKRIWLCALAASCLAALFSALPAPGQAAKPKKEAPADSAADSGVPKTRALGTVGAWSAYASGDKTGRICYLVGRPQNTDSAGVARKSPVAMVTHRPSENIANVVSFIEGYPLKEGSDVALEVDDKKFDLFTNDDSAWARTAELDRTIVSAFIKGRNAVVKGVPNKGKPTTDTYTLAGFTKALALIDEACGVSRAGTAAPQKAAAAQKAAEPEKATGSEKSPAPQKASTHKTSHKKTSARKKKAPPAKH
jgi:hypothetical protein